MQTALHPALDYLARLVRQGGPTVADHALLDFHFGQLAEDLERDAGLRRHWAVRAHARERTLAYAADLDFPEPEAAVDGMARTLREAGGYTVELNVRLQGRELPGAMTRHLINVVQELVTNTIKYARAERIGIQVLARDGMLNLTYEDDGRGFDAARPTEGIGLRNMRERVEELGGELHLDAMTGRGTSVVIDLPLIP